MGAILKVKIYDVDETLDPYFGWRQTNDLGVTTTIKFYFKNLRSNPYEVTIGANLNQALKDAVDLDLVPSGNWSVTIDANYLYIESLLDGLTFNFIGSPAVGSPVATQSIVYTGEVSYDGDSQITLTQALPSGAVLNAYNDNVIRFTAEGIEKFDLLANEQLPATLYPSPTGEYFLNLKDYAVALINQNLFEDEITPNIEVDGYVYPDPSLTLELDLKLTSGAFLQTSKFYFLKSVAQIAKYLEKNITKNYILLPYSGLSHKVTYYEGYPFDVSIFSNVLRTITLLNKTTTNSVNLDFSKFVNRLFFSQGSENFTIDDVLPMQTGINRLEVQFDEISKIDLIVKKKESVCAPYFKFYRNNGGWGYIRFEKQVGIQSKTREGKDVRVDYNGIQNTLTKTINEGKETTVVLELHTELLESWEMENFKDFIKSPRVEMFTGDLFQQQTLSSWIGVSVKSSSLDTTKTKTLLNREKVKIEIEEYNLHL